MEIIPHLDLVEIMKQITDAFFVLNRNGEFKFINKRGAEILNRNHPNDLIGKLIWDEFPEVLKSNFHLHYYRTVMEKQIPVEFDEFFPEPLNRWYHVRVYPITDGITVFIHDTTDKKLRQKRTDAYYEQLFMKNHDGILLLDVDGKITNVNDGIERISGYRSSYFIDKQYFDLELVKREDLGLLRTAFQKVRKGDIQHGIIDIFHRNGAIIHCDINSFPVEVMNEIVGVFAIVRDVTQIKELECSLRRSEQRHRSLKYHNPEGICSFDLNGKLIGVNPALERMSGYSKEDFLQLHLEQLFHPKDIPTLNECIQDILDGKGTVDSFEITMINKEGYYVHTVVTVLPIYIDEKLEGFYLIFKDVTKAKKTEELLIQSEKLFAVGQLAASIVHEIRNPLTSLMGFLQLIEHSDGEKNEYLKIMSDELMRIHSITNELLVLAKPQAKKTIRENIPSLLNDVMKLMGSQAIKVGIELVLYSEENVPDIMCDGQQLKQVFINLIKNGIEAMDEKPGKITIRVVRKDHHIILSFTDEGIGMTPEQIKKLGEPFFTTKQKGTGLGMLTTFKIIENHDGNIEIESEVGKGTTIHVILPIQSE